MNPHGFSQTAGRRLLLACRLLIGLLQGLALFLVYQAAENQRWVAGNSGIFAALLMVAGIVPVLWISALGHFPARVLWRWLLLVAALLGLLGFYDIWRSVGAPYWNGGNDPAAARLPSPVLWFNAVSGLLMAHAMIAAGVAEQCRMASYRTIFEKASKLGIQLLFATVFTGVSWLVLSLGAALFEMIHLEFLKTLLGMPGFAMPVITFAFACALHITDVQPAIVQGVRSLVLVLLSWILPVAVVLIGGFLLTLPFTGFAPLWATKTATAMLLAAAAVLVSLINAAFQDGSVVADVAAPVRVTARVAALLLLPLALIAAYALGLRVAQYGWTVDRLVAAFALVVALCCALGYFWAAVRSPQWLSRIAVVNVWTALVFMLLQLAIFSPLLDPARISVNSQLAQLHAGKIDAIKFDYGYLRFSGQRFGNAALQRMAAGKDGKYSEEIAAKAQAALASEVFSNAELWQPVDRKQLLLNIQVHTPGAALPESFLAQNWREAHAEKTGHYPKCLYNRYQSCEVQLLDMDADGVLEILLWQKTGPIFVFRYSQDQWVQVGHVTLPRNCASIEAVLHDGYVGVAPAAMGDIVISGQHYPLTRELLRDCSSVPEVKKP